MAHHLKEETLAQCCNRHTSAVNQVEGCCGDASPVRLAKGEPNCSKELQKAMKKAEGKVPACSFMKGAAQKVFGRLLKNPGNGHVLGEGEFPETMEQALEALIMCEQRNGAEKPQQPQGPCSQGKRDTKSPEMSFAQPEGKHFCCGKAGCRSDSCKDKGKPKEDWVANKASKARESTGEDNQQHTMSSWMVWGDQSCRKGAI